MKTDAGKGVSDDDAAIDYDELLAFAVTLAQQAGTVMLAYFNKRDKDIQIKSDESPVTAADKQINQMVIDAVHSRYSTHGILAEEGSSNAERPLLWVCDPIDGTKNFIQGIPTAAFSLAFVVDGIAQIGVIHDPFQSKTYAAVRGKQTTVNGKPVRVSDKTLLNGAQVAVTSSYRQLIERQVFIERLRTDKAEPVLVPGNVFKSTLVTSGFIDGYIFPGRSSHDVAAAKVIVESAGGKVTDLYGEEQRYDGAIFGAIISNGLIHQELVAHMAAFGPENYIGY